MPLDLASLSALWPLIILTCVLVLSIRCVPRLLPIMAQKMAMFCSNTQYTSSPRVRGIPDDMKDSFWSFVGVMYLAPVTTRSVLNYECESKSDKVSYRAYAQQLYGEDIIEDKDWKRMCGFSCPRFEKNNPEEMDMTALSCLFGILCEMKRNNEVTREEEMRTFTYDAVQSKKTSMQTDNIRGLNNVAEAAKKDPPVISEKKKKDRKKTGQVKMAGAFSSVAMQATDTYMISNKVRAVKNLRNKTLHEESTASNPRTFIQIVSTLEELIQDAGDTYYLSQNQVGKMQKELHDEIKWIVNGDKKTFPYICGSLLTKGIKEASDFLVNRFAREQLLFDIDKVQRQAVFQDPELIQRSARNQTELSYTQIFHTKEKYIVVSGVPGSGKTTLLINLALQFFQLQGTKPEYLKEFSLLIYVDCREREARTLSDVIQQHFKRLCDESPKETVLEVLLQFNVLFLVDAYDQANSQSEAVVEDLIKKSMRFNCRIIITSRHHAVKRLVSLFKANYACSDEYEILPLCKLRKQLEFLRKYANHLEDQSITSASEDQGNQTITSASEDLGDQSITSVSEDLGDQSITSASEDLGDQSINESMQKCFSDLNDQVRSMFSEPIYLVLFCQLFIHRPESIPQLKTPSDVAKEVFAMHKTLIEEKMINFGYKDLSFVIENQFLIIGELAVHFLYEEIMIFTENEFLQLQRGCKAKFERSETLRDVHLRIFMSQALKVHSRLVGCPVTYSFHHKTLQERFAALHVSDQIRNTSQPIRQILLGATATSVRVQSERALAPQPERALGLRP